MGKESISLEREVPDLGSSSVKVLLISPEDVDLVWDEAEPLIDLALRHSEGELISSDLIPIIKSGE